MRELQLPEQIRMRVIEQIGKLPASVLQLSDPSPYTVAVDERLLQTKLQIHQQMSES